ncbi:helix-turn-helix domain-containing protein [Streptomyces lunaelactis]|nr:helix-turn-helix transcriptional regulator [Streptomyces lunaelactis]
MFREFAGLRQRELAERVCVHEETIASVEQGRRPLKPDLAKVWTGSSIRRGRWRRR